MLIEMALRRLLLERPLRRRLFADPAKPYISQKASEIEQEDSATTKTVTEKQEIPKAKPVTPEMKIAAETPTLPLDVSGQESKKSTSEQWDDLTPEKRKELLEKLNLNEKWSEYDFDSLPSFVRDDLYSVTHPKAKEKPKTGKTFQGQTDEAYCLECLEGHIMNAKTELRHAIDRFRTSKEMSPGVVEKVRVAIQELQGINEDVKNTLDADPQIKKGLDDILNEVRWIRKEFGVSGRGLTRGLGTQKDLEELRDRVDKLQEVSYDLADDCPSCSEAVGLGWSLNLAKQLNMPNADQLVKDVEDEKVSTKEVLSQIETFAQEKGTKEDVESLQEIKRLMYTPLKELEKEKI